jgi:hypothetical protein
MKDEAVFFKALLAGLLTITFLLVSAGRQYSPWR